ncbi:YbjO family protein [Erwinia sp. E_sp_B04_7]|uniref:YbjO family protein n=1 Tax=unclassified Erwinia TaxID=2622719 RepID=UPI0030D32AAB
MSEVLRESKAVLASPSSVPVPVLVAGIAIVATRVINVALQVHDSGLAEVASFVYRSAQAWDSTLIFIASQLIFFFELRCAVALMRGKNWGRYGFVAAQLVVILYMFCASVGWIYPELFSINGENNLQIIHLLLSQKLPDFLVIMLLFLPATSRGYYRQP